MNRSITQSPGRYYVNNSKIDITQPVHKTKYFSGKKDNNNNYPQAAPTFDEYDKLLDQEKAYKQINMMNREVGELKTDKQALEQEKKQKDYEIQKLIAEKEFLMRNVTQNNGKLKDYKKSNISNMQDENERLKRELDEQKLKEMQMQTMISNQKQQLTQLESRYKSNPNGKPKPLLTSQDIDEGDDPNPKKFGNSLGSYNNGQQSTRNNTPTNSFRLRKQKYITPTKDYASTSNGLKIEDWQPRNFTPLDQGTERRRSLANNKSIFQDPNINPTYLKTNEKVNKNFESSIKESFLKIPPLDYDQVMPGFDPMVASRDEMNQYINILKKQFSIQERKYINELENLRIRIQRLEIEKLEILDSSKSKEVQAAEYENKLKDREKELSLAYIKLKNPDQKINNGSSYSIPIPGSRQDQQSKISKIQNIETLKGQLSSEDMMIIATHARLSKITIWSSSDRIQGLTFQYTKPDGTTLEADNSYFFQRNYRYDTFGVSEEETMQIVGKYNIKGVKYIQINNSRGPHKKYRPIGIAEEDLDNDESFVIPINKECNILKIMFPNIFSYDMKGSKIQDRHHQNFIYVETNRIASLQNAEVIWNRDVLDRKTPIRDPQEGKRTDSPPRSYIIPGSGTAAAQMPQQDGDSKLAGLSTDNAKFYYSDYQESYKLNEVVEQLEGGRINFSDGELIFMEKRLKIFKVFIWADENYVYGLKFSYLTPDGFNLIEGKQHAGIDMQHLSYKEVDLSNPEIFLHRVYFYRRDNMFIEKLVFLLSNGQKFSWGRQVPSREAKECLIELKQTSSYIYGSLIPQPQMQIPGQFVLSNLRVSEIR